MRRGPPAGTSGTGGAEDDPAGPPGTALRETLVAIEMSTRVANRETSIAATRGWLSQIEALCLEAEFYLARLVGFTGAVGGKALGDVDVGRLLVDVVQRHRCLAIRTNTTLDLRSVPRMPRLALDPTLLDGVIATVLVGALRFCPGGVVRIATGFGARERRLSIHVVASVRRGDVAPLMDPFHLPFCRRAIEGLGGAFRSTRRGATSATLLLDVPGVPTEAA